MLLDVPAELAAERAENRASQDADRAKDAYERDDGLQRRTGEVYSGLAAANGADGGWSPAPTWTPPPWPPSWVNSRLAGVLPAFYRDLVTPWTP